MFIGISVIQIFLILNMNVEVPAKSRRTNTPRVNRGECGMVVYGKGRLEKLESCPISAAYVPAYAPPTLKCEIYTRIPDIYRAGQIFVVL